MTAITKEEFRNWLINKKADEIVGFNRTDLTCPLSYFHLSRNKQLQRVLVTATVTILYPYSSEEPVWYRHSLDSWHNDFVWKLDKLSIHSMSITAGTCLQVLDTCFDK